MLKGLSVSNEKIVINSIDSLAEAWLVVREFFKNNRHFTIEFYTKRSLSSNALQHKWYSDIAKQTGHTDEYMKGFCKLKFGWSILVTRKNDKDKDQIELIQLMLNSVDWYKKSLEWNCSLSEAKMRAINTFPVTSLFTKAESKVYMKKIEEHCIEHDIILSIKEDL